MRTGYADLVKVIGRDGFASHRDEVSGVPFLYNAGQRSFISYDDPASLRMKSRYVIDRGLAGVMFWELGGDTAGNDLLGAISEVLLPAHK